MGNLQRCIAFQFLWVNMDSVELLSCCYYTYLSKAVLLSGKISCSVIHSLNHLTNSNEQKPIAIQLVNFTL